MSAKKSRSNKKQISVLVDFMSTHNHLATREFTGPLGAKRAESQWLVLKEILKEHGPDRSVNQWKQTWKDIKKGARAENAAASRGLKATGNAQPVPSVSETSIKVLNIIGHDSSTGIGPEESAVDVADDIIEIEVTENLNLSGLSLPPTFFADEVENIPPTPSTSKRKEKIKEGADECFQRLKAGNNSSLQSIDNNLREQNVLLREKNVLLREQNVLLREQNVLLREQYAHLARANK